MGSTLGLPSMGSGFPSSRVLRLFKDAELLGAWWNSTERPELTPIQLRLAALLSPMGEGYLVRQKKPSRGEPEATLHWQERRAAIEQRPMRAKQMQGSTR